MSFSARIAAVFAALTVLGAASLARQGVAAGEEAGLRLLGSRVPPEELRTWKPASGRYNQPHDFIPGETKFEGDDCLFMSEDSWSATGDAVVRLPAPYELRSFMFKCNDTDAVVEIRKAGRRHALYQYVEGFSAAPDGRTLFLSNQRALDGGRFETFVGLVDIPTKKKTPLPRLACLPRFETSALDKARFEGGRLLTIEDKNEQDGRPSERTELCVWAADGRLLARLEGLLRWRALAAMVLDDRVGLLPSAPDVLYAYSSLGGKECRLWLQHLQEPSRRRVVGLGLRTDEEGGCPHLDWDLAAAGLESGIVRFRKHNFSTREPDAPWETLPVAGARR